MAGSPGDLEALKQTVYDTLDSLSGACNSSLGKPYRLALRRSWEMMEMLVGTGGAVAVVRYAVKVASRQRPEVALVSVDEAGVNLDPLEQKLSGGRPGENCACLRELCLAVLLTLAELTGDVMVGPLLKEIREQTVGDT